MICHITLAVILFTFILHGYTLSKVGPWHLASVKCFSITACFQVN